MKIRVQVDLMCSICKINGTHIKQEYKASENYTLANQLEEFAPDGWTVVWDEQRDEFIKTFCEDCGDAGTELIRKAALGEYNENHANAKGDSDEDEDDDDEKEEFDPENWYRIVNEQRGIKQIYVEWEIELA